MRQYLKDLIRSYRHKKILKIVNISEHGKVLDVSCSDGKFLNHLHDFAPDLELFGIDISNEDIEKAKKDFPYANFKEESVSRLTFDDNTFDIIFSIMSLHHYQNPNDFLKEVFRVLKPDGVLYLADLIPKYIWMQKIHNWKGCPEPYHFEKYYSIQDIEIILKPHQFRIISDRRISSIFRIKLLEIKKF